MFTWNQPAISRITLETNVWLITKTMSIWESEDSRICLFILDEHAITFHIFGNGGWENAWNAVHKMFS